MNIGLERAVMDTLFIAHTNGVSFLTFNKITKISGVKKPSLQRVLPRLVKRRWVIRKAFWMQGNELLTVSYGLDGFIKNFFSQLKIELPKLHRKKFVGIDWNGPAGHEPIYESLSYKKLFNEFMNSDSTERLPRFKGVSPTIKRVYDQYLIPKKMEGYTLIFYPYLYFPPHLKPDEQESDPEIPQGSRRFWKRAANDIVPQLDANREWFSNLQNVVSHALLA